MFFNINQPHYLVNKYIFPNPQRPKSKGQFGGTFRRADILKRRAKINRISNDYIKGINRLYLTSEITRDSKGNYIKGL